MRERSIIFQHVARTAALLSIAFERRAGFVVRIFSTM